MKKNFVPFIVFGIILGIVGIIVLTIFYQARVIPNDYAIVFDAGSSGTRMYIYTWKSGFSAAKGDPLVVEESHRCVCKDKGVDKIRSDDEIRNSFNDCIEQANAKIPSDRYNRTYIILAATAGMRLLEVRNSTQSNIILEYIRSYFAKSNFSFKNKTQVRIINGQDEGTNAWISANYFLNNFKPNANPLDTSGILDLGGASTQIVYVPKDPNVNANNSKFFSEIRIYGINYKPYSNSFLCWGINELSLLYKTYILRSNSYQSKSNAGCYPKNYVNSLKADEIFNSPCANGEVFSDFYNFTANTSYIKPGSTYGLDGLSDINKCNDEIGVLLPKSECDFKSCSFYNVYQPSVLDRKFSAFSTFYYTMSNTEKLLKDDFDKDMDKFKNATNYICSLDKDQLSELNKTNDAGINAQFLYTTCFSNVYMIKLLESYGFKSFSDMTIDLKIAGYTVGWTLGYLINELNRDDFLPYEVPPRKLSSKYYIPLVIVASILVIALLALIFVWFFKSHANQSEMSALKRGSGRNEENA